MYYSKCGSKSQDGHSVELGMNADTGSLERHSPYEEVDLNDNRMIINQLEDYEESKNS